MEVMKKKEEEGKFLDKSDHGFIRSKKLNSLSMIEFLQLMEEKF